ncbi:MAG: type I-MYXAN CRISPR-associated protein Cas5/Cmx5/DevS [Blastocatellia bacterium]|nr:type I-MYXAN CRISPR-associated protein Cas5/Cmx5/DevS [Blastocatellia bacterium]
MQIVGLYVSVPVASFKVPRAREYFETFPCPPPATVYGMLLSLVGEINRSVHKGVEIAIGMLSEPEKSLILRTVWRIKRKKTALGTGKNKRPDYQEVLTNVHFAVWIRPGQDVNKSFPLAKRIHQAVSNPSSITRFGGLSLGESTFLVDEVKFLEWKNLKCLKCRLLTLENEGLLSLPIWPDHVGFFTRWGQYNLIDFDLSENLPETAWTVIRPPE